MAKYYSTEEQVMKALSVDDFQNLNQDKIKKFISMIHNMDKEVARAVMNQFPSFAEVAKTMLAELNKMYDTILKSNNDCQNAAISAYQKILDELSEMLKKEYLTFEEKQNIIDKMIDIAGKIDDKDSENKEFLLKIFKSALTVIAGVGLGILAAACLGSEGSEDSENSEDDFVDNDWKYYDV